MIILEKPYVSDLLAGTAEELGVPVLENAVSRRIAETRNINIVGGAEFIALMKGSPRPPLYSNSEDAIGWMEKNLGFLDLPDKIDLCKDKVRFRKMLEGEYPDLFYTGVAADRLDSIDVTKIGKPFIIKPAVGFFSLAVYKVASDGEWPAVLARIRRDIERVGGMYPEEVLDTGRFIIEGNIPGEEFAVDLYYDDSGEPVILDILHHIFASEYDMSDRTYVTSSDIIRKYSGLFQAHLGRFGAVAGLRNMPMHIEFRVDGDRVVPIEANPMRFAAWCTTDIAWHAWGINTVEYFLRGLRPDWESIFRGREGKVYPLVVACVPDEIELGDVRGIDYERFEANFRKPLSVRKIDYMKYRTFAFVFSETDEDNRGEIERMLKADLGEYVIL